MSDPNDLDLDEELDETETDGSGDDGGQPEPAPQDGDGGENAPAGTDKRISDLMSAAQKAEARANKFEAELNRLKGAGTGTTGEPAKPAETDEFLSVLRDSTRETIYGSDPRLARYKVKPEAITGSTPTEMRASFDSLRAQIDSMESVIRSEVMREFGIDPEIVPGKTAALPKFGEMSDEEFAKFIETRRNSTVR